MGHLGPEAMQFSLPGRSSKWDCSIIVGVGGHGTRCQGNSGKPTRRLLKSSPSIGVFGAVTRRLLPKISRTRGAALKQSSSEGGGEGGRYRYLVGFRLAPFLVLDQAPLMKDRGLEPPADFDATENSDSTSADCTDCGAASWARWLSLPVIVRRRSVIGDRRLGRFASSHSSGDSWPCRVSAMISIER
jgi:hypothetical protein